MKRKNSIRLTRAKIELLIFILCLIFMLGAVSYAQENAVRTSELIVLKSDLNQFAAPASFVNYRQLILADTNLYNGHTYDYYNAKYIRAASAKKTGVILTSVGAGAAIVGLVTSALLASDAYGGENEALFVGGVFMFVAGVTIFNVGIPFWISGGIKNSNNRKAMEKGWPNRKHNENVLSFGTTKNGIGIMLSL